MAAGDTVIPMATISFKVTEREAARIRRLAKKEASTVSEYLRRRAMPEEWPLAPIAAYHMKISPVTGLPVMHGPASATRVSSEQVREFLVDFP